MSILTTRRGFEREDSKTVEIECSLINKTDTYSMSDEIEENVEYEGEYSTIENNME